MKGYKLQWRKNFTLDKIAHAKTLLLVELWDFRKINYIKDAYDFNISSKGGFRKHKKQFKNLCRKEHCDVVFLKFMGDEAYETWNTGKHQYTKVE